MLNTDQYLNVAYPPAAPQLFTLRTIDDGKSIRTYRASSTLQYTLSVAATVTKENAGMDTDRKVVRVDLKKTDSTTSKTATGSVYLVVAAPQLIVTDSEMKGLLFGLIEWFAQGLAAPGTYEAPTLDNQATIIGDALTALLQGTV